MFRMLQVRAGKVAHFGSGYFNGSWQVALQNAASSTLDHI